MNEHSTLKRLALKRTGSRKRCSSYDLSGGNSDFIKICAGEKKNLADLTGAGCISHIWMTCSDNKDAPDCKTKQYLRRTLLRMYWDGEKNPSVEVPLGDFFGLGHGLTKNFNSAPLNMSPQNGKGFNCFFSMPFADSAIIEIENQSQTDIILFYYIDYETYPSLSDNYLRFHASWKRENPCCGLKRADLSNEEFLHAGKNLSGNNNYVILKAKGHGHYIGCHLDIHNLNSTREWNWYGEGDDMIFIDGETWPPSLHGTGTEDYFNTAFCPTQEECYPYHGVILAGKDNWSGKISLYRYHIEDPVMFNKSIRVTIEHGHNNSRSDDYSSTAYWYQTEPHELFDRILSPELRDPLPEIIELNSDRMKKILNL